MATPASDGSVDFYEDQVKTPMKRRLSSSHSDDMSKKRKVVTATSDEIYSSAFPATKGLPTEVWQRVFSSLPPDDLCRCMRVNHAFNSYLTEAKASMSVEQTDKRVHHSQVVDSESIWVGSRKVFAPSLPPSLPGITERALLSLLGNSICQSCGAEPSDRQMTQVMNTGGTTRPGHHGVCIVWPFAMRLCPPCFSAESITVGHLSRSVTSIPNAYKDIELLKSKDNRLIKGLPFGFRTKDNDYISSPAVAPFGVAVSKVFSRQQIARLHAETLQVENDYGRGAADEWIKGLADTAKSQSADIARWVKWEKELPPGMSVGQVFKSIMRRPKEPLLRVCRTPPNSSLTSVAGVTPASQNSTARNVQGHSMLHARKYRDCDSYTIISIYFFLSSSHSLTLTMFCHYFMSSSAAIYRKTSLWERTTHFNPSFYLSELCQLWCQHLSSSLPFSALRIGRPF